MGELCRAFGEAWEADHIDKLPMMPMFIPAGSEPSRRVPGRPLNLALAHLFGERCEGPILNYFHVPSACYGVLAEKLKNPYYEALQASSGGGNENENG